uniref:Biogenesis of lysosome-related organelles complex 1 subunit 5 n=1 Tax=Taeniopygia guttata TaxID=59729 RepID=A0A674GU06_TAEGU
MAMALPSAVPWRCPPMERAVAAALRPCPRVPPRKMAAAVRGAEELELLERLLGLPSGNKYGVQGERKVPVLQSNSGPGLTGLMTIAAHLVRQARKDQLLGSTAEEKAVVQQWLEYRVTRVNGGSSKEDTRTILKEKRGLRELRVLENLKNTIFETNERVLPKCEQAMQDNLSETFKRLQAANAMIHRLQERECETRKLQADKVMAREEKCIAHWEEFMKEQQKKRAEVDEEHRKAMERLKEQYSEMEKELAKYASF